MSMTMVLLIGSSLGSLSHKNTQIKKFHNANKRMDKSEFRIRVLSMSSSRLSILKA
jgi:hypothetical protein